MDLFSDKVALRRKHFQEEDEFDPMASVANISDAMLVFACGLLISIVLAWNLDISEVAQVELDPSQRVEDIESVQDFMESSGNSYVERGTVYQDPNTGTLYMLESDNAAQGSASGAARSGSSGQ